MLFFASVNSFLGLEIRVWLFSFGRNGLFVQGGKDLWKKWILPDFGPVKERKPGPLNWCPEAHGRDLGPEFRAIKNGIWFKGELFHS